MAEIGGAFGNVLPSGGLQPHGYGLLWRQDVFWTEFISDFVIAAACFGISAAILVFAAKRRDFPYRWMLYLFGAFMACSGAAHLAGIWTMWVPDFGHEALAKAVTAIVAFGTALAMWPLVPKLLRVPSHAQLEEAHEQLRAQYEETRLTKLQIVRLNQELEDRVSERTAALEETNRRLENEIERRAEIEEALRTSRNRAEEADAAKSRFLTTISHELRTPLTTLLGYAQLLDREAAANARPKQRQYAKNVLAGGYHMVRLVDDLSDLNRIQAGQIAIHREKLDVRGIFEEIEPLGRVLAASRDVTLDVDLDSAAGVRILADRVRIEQILLNLLSNAVKYNKTGGFVAVRVQATGESDVRIEVSDTGSGIPPGKIEHLFKPFERLGRESGEVEGTGIGLSITKALVELMEGTISCDSREGEGTIFVVSLPRAPGAEAEPDAARTADPPVARGTIKLLYVEDNPADQALIRDVIEDSDIGTLQIADTAEKGLELAVANRPDIIFVGIDPPGNDGLELLQRLRATPTTRNIRVVALGAGATRSDIQIALANGFDAHIAKPIDIGRVVEEIEQVGSGRNGAEPRRRSGRSGAATGQAVPRRGRRRSAGHDDPREVTAR